ncbi:MAG: hypothetical protein GY828_03830 [Candidatus Gracilibacteria bacterium]|nr:hypothetical protein [Candidatus Gracilibacteria bacterium]
MKYIYSFFFLLSLFFTFYKTALGGLDLQVSPIKYEINVEPGDHITHTATLFNKGDQSLDIYVSKAEFQSDGQSGQPKIVEYNPADNTIGSWITLHTTNFIIDPSTITNDGKKKYGETQVSFDILIPSDATPGGHYGAVFFENDSTSASIGSNVAINVDYGVILLINVAGEVVKEGELSDVVIKNNSGGGGGGYSRRKKDICPLGDFSRSNFDKKCIDDIFKIGTGDKEDENTDLALNSGNTDEKENKKDKEKIKKDKKEDKELDVVFKLPFENTGNTHIKPTGKIKLVDEDGRQIKSIGKKVIINEHGAITREEIVDYIPINEVGGNVLPQTARIFEGEWKGFPYKIVNEEGDEEVFYWTPGEYYTKKNTPENVVLNFWERILERTNKKKVTAHVELSYLNAVGEEIEFNSAEEFDIEYVDTYIGLNKYVISFGIIGGIFLFFLMIFKYSRKKKCIHCNARIPKKHIVCHFCGEKQKKKKKKSGEKKKKDSM